MAALTVNTITPTDAVVALTAVTASDTIAADRIGSHGVVYEINNANASADTVTVSDPGVTPAGNAPAGGVRTYTVAAGARKRLLITRNNVNPATGVVTITHSVTATVTAEAFATV